jgi:hypothetical protein
VRLAVIGNYRQGAIGNVGCQVAMAVGNPGAVLKPPVPGRGLAEVAGLRARGWHWGCRCGLRISATGGNVGLPLGQLGPIAVDASGAAPAGIVGVMDDAIDHRCEMAAALNDQSTKRQLVGP